MPYSKYNLYLNVKVFELKHLRQFFYYCFSSRAKLKIRLIGIFLISSINYSVQAEENQTDKQTNTETEKLNAPWPVDLTELSKNNSADEFIWSEVNGEKLLTLKYWAKGRKFRGNALLVPAQGENADHPRMMKPLASQLSSLGWQVFVPNLPIEDYPIEITQEESNSEQNDSAQQQDAKQKPETDSDTSKENKNSELITYFNQVNDYQSFINEGLRQIVASAQPKAENFLLIGNQNSAYWILESTKQLTDIHQVILLEPTLPKMIQQDLKSSFQGQYLPIYTFIQSDTESSIFTRAFSLQLWQSNYQRLNRGLINNKQLEIEDVRLAKTITGWIESMKKTSN